MDKLIIRGGGAAAGHGARERREKCGFAVYGRGVAHWTSRSSWKTSRRCATFRLRANLLAAMGAEVELGYGRAQHRTTIHCKNLTMPEASYELVKTMRSSDACARTASRALRPRPGFAAWGCAIGSRPIDMHIKGLEQLGAKITQDHGYVEASASRLKGTEIVFDKNHRHGNRRSAHGRRFLPKAKPFCRTAPENRKLPTWPRCSIKWERRSKAQVRRQSA